MIAILLLLATADPVPNSWVIVPLGSAPATAPAPAPTIVKLPVTEPSKTVLHSDPITNDLLICALKCRDKYDKCKADGYQEWSCRIEYVRCLERCDDDYKRRRPPPKPRPKKETPPTTVPSVRGGVTT
jgi:hypothetical protein